MYNHGQGQNQRHRQSPHGVFVRRWAGFVSALWLMQFSGTYGFSNYSTALKQVLGLNQKQLNRLSVAKDLGDSFGIVAGILSNYLPAWCLLCISACIGFCGFGVQWLVISNIISPLPYWIMFLTALLAGNTVSWMNTAVFTVALRNFPRNRGPVVGLFKAYMGLSAAIYSKICDILFSSSSSMYLLMLAVVPPAFCIWSSLFFQPVPPADTLQEEKEEKRSIFMFNLIASALAIYLVIIDIYIPSQGLMSYIALGVLFALVLAPVFVPFFLFKVRSATNKALLNPPIEDLQGEIQNNSYLESKVNVSVDTKNSINSDMESNTLKQPLIESGSTGKSLEVASKSRCCAPLPKLGEDRGTLTLLRSWDFYLLYFALFCGAGSGMVFSNNLGQIGQSFGFGTVTVFTSFFSLGNFFGRISSGLASEQLLRLFAMPRSVWMAVVKVPMMAMFLWLASGSQASLYVGSLVLGFCHGSLITLTIPTVSEFYGLKYLGTNFMVANTHLLAGSFTLSGIVAGYLYDKEAKKQLGSILQSFLSANGTLTCYGSTCYGTTFYILVGLLIFAVGIDGVITYYSRPLYARLKILNTQLR